MTDNEIMVNEETMEIAEGIATASISKSLVIAGGIGLAVLGGVVAYKYLVKPFVAKMKAKKAQQEEVGSTTINPEDDEFAEFNDVD